MVRYCDDDRLEIDNNAVERALRAVALGRKNYLLAGSDDGEGAPPPIYSLIGSTKLNAASTRKRTGARCNAHRRSPVAAQPTGRSPA